MSDIFREVDEDLRQEHYKKLWKRYGAYIIGAAAAIVVAVGGYQAWQAWDQSQRLAASDRYAEAIALARRDRIAAAETDLAEIVAPNDGGYGVLAAFEQAGLLVESGDRDGAIALWDRLSASAEAGPAFQGIATLLSVMHQIDDGDPSALDARLASLTVAGGAFRPSALELQAILALRQGDAARARELYALVTDDLTAPASLRARGAQMLDALSE